MKQIIVTFDEDGGMTVEMAGYVGRDCYADAAKLKAMLAKLGLILQGEVVKPKREEVVVDGIKVRGA
jgi:predicted transcriptional regulator